MDLDLRLPKSGIFIPSIPDFGKGDLGLTFLNRVLPLLALLLTPRMGGGTVRPLWCLSETLSHLHLTWALLWGCLELALKVLFRLRPTQC